jgi:hypothetical protein
MTYGYEVKGHSDKMLNSARNLSNLGTSVVLPGALLVNELPFRMSFLLYFDALSLNPRLVRHIPEWLPWFSYKPLARIGHALGEEVKNDPMQFVRESMVSSNLRVTYVQALTRPCLAQWHGTAFPCTRRSYRGRNTKRT